jgi:hypothetical protein
MKECKEEHRKLFNFFNDCNVKVMWGKEQCFCWFWVINTGSSRNSILIYFYHTAFYIFIVKEKITMEYSMVSKKNKGKEQGGSRYVFIA